MTDEDGFPAPFDNDLVHTLRERVIMQQGPGKWGREGGRISRFYPAG